MRWKRAGVRRQIVLLILITTALRLGFGAAIGLGVDESYMVSAGRVLSLGYFDHPPAAWWLVWGSTNLFASEAPIVARLPFIALFALTTWMMALLGEAIAGRRAGFWAAATLNLSPVFGITGGGWVLPDGPLDCALTGAALCLMRALAARDFPRAASAYWGAAGVCAGLALFSKYSATMTIAGALLFLLTDPAHWFWLRRREPYAAAAIALAVFSPVIVWNAAHHWASFAFQGARAGGARFRPELTLTTLAGEALFVLPWFWLPMVVLGTRALRGDWRGRLLAGLAAPPVIGFALIAAWSSHRVLYHWAAPGYLMLFPFLGRFVAERWDSRAVRGVIAGTAALSLICVAVTVAQVQFDWLGPVMPAKDPTAEGLDWTSVHDELTTRGLLPPGTIVGVTNWRDGGKIAHGLGPEIPVICLNEDARQFGIAAPAAKSAGADVLLLSVDRIPESVIDRFDRVETLPPVAVTLRGRTLKVLAVATGHRLKAP